VLSLGLLMAPLQAQQRRVVNIGVVADGGI
jgi:hypothetical protein